MDRFINHIKKHIEIYISLIIALALAILAYLWVPKQGYDLYQYYNWLEKLRTFNTKDVIGFFKLRGEPVIMLYFYIIAKIGNFQLLQVLPTFLFYFIALFMLVDYAKSRKISYSKVTFVGMLLFSLCEYVYIAGCFRYTLAFIIFALALYLENIKGKNNKWIWILYVLPCLIHTATFILLAFRILSSIKNKKLIIAVMSAIIIVMVFPKIIVLPISYISIEGLNRITMKIIMYFNKWQIPLNLQYIYRIAQTLFLIFTSIYFDIINKENNIFKKYNKYLYIIVIFTILCIPYHTLFFRFNDLLLILMLEKIMELFNSFKYKKEKYFFFIVFISFMVAGIRIQIPVFKQMYFGN